MQPSAKMLKPDVERSHSGTVVTTQTIVIALAAIMLVGAVLRFFQLGAESYWYDELIMARLADMEWQPLLSQLVSSGRPPLYVVLGKAWTDIFGSSEAAGRSLSAVLGTLSIPAMYAVGEALFDRKTGLISALIMALSGFALYYSQEFRYYSLALILGLLALYFFVRALETGRNLHFVLFGAVGILLFYTHTLAAVLLVAPGLYFLLNWKRYRDLRVWWLLSQAIVVVGVLPWLIPVLVQQVQALISPTGGKFAAGTWVEVPAIYAPLRTLVNFVVLGRRYVTWQLVAVAGVVLLLGVGLYVLSRGVRRWTGELQSLAKRFPAFVREWRDSLLLTVLWLVIPIALVYIGSLVVSPFYVDRYMIVAAPALYLLIAVAVVYLRRVVPEYLSLAVLAIVLSGAIYLYYADDVKDEWREAALYIEANRAPEDELAFAAERGVLSETENVRDNFFWYYGGEPSGCLVNVREGTEAVAEQLASCQQGGGNVWLIMWDYVPDPLHLEQAFKDGGVDGTRLLGMEKFKGATVFLFDAQ